MKKYYALIYLLILFGTGNTRAQFTVLHYCSQLIDDANDPSGSLILVGGNLYGMSRNGGEYSNGNIFYVPTGGGYYSVYSFVNGLTGTYPGSSLVLTGNMIYGMTASGGGYNQGCIFKYNTNVNNSYSEMLDFNGAMREQGSDPLSDLTLSGSMLYGMTTEGGAYGYGNIFATDTTNSVFTDLLDFNGTNGEYPQSGALAISGNVLYGMVPDGGAYGYGSLFSIHTDGSSYKDLLDFDVTNGSYPIGEVIISGNLLYGMASDGGANSDGLIFSIDTNGNGFKDMFDFNGTNGSNPQGTFTLSGSTLYGNAAGDGAFGDGCIFSIDTGGSGYTDLFDFNGSDGAGPNGKLVLSGGVLYGVTDGGGPSSDGVIFSFKDTSVTTSAKQLSAEEGQDFASVQFSVYPNPSCGIFTVALTHAELACPALVSRVSASQFNIEVYDVLGEKVFTKSYQPKANGYQLDLRSKSNGVYFYKVIGDGGVIGNGKVVIEK